MKIIKTLSANGEDWLVDCLDCLYETPLKPKLLSPERAAFSTERKSERLFRAHDRRSAKWNPRKVHTNVRRLPQKPRKKRRFLRRRALFRGILQRRSPTKRPAAIAPSPRTGMAQRFLQRKNRIHSVKKKYEKKKVHRVAVRLDVRQYGHKPPQRTTQILNRFPIQNRREQARQQTSVGTAQEYGHKPPQRTTQILNRFPIQNRREQTRQQTSAGTARRGSKRLKSQT